MTDSGCLWLKKAIFKLREQGAAIMLLSLATLTAGTDARHFDGVRHRGVGVVIWVLDDVAGDAGDDWSV